MLAKENRRTSLGTRFDPITFTDLLRLIRLAIEEHRRLSIGYTNLHGAYVGRMDSGLTAFLDNADIVYADGMPLVWWRRLLYNDVGFANRITLSQNLPELLEFCSTNGYSIYYLGSEARVVEAGAKKLLAAYPNLQLKVASGYFDKSSGSPENEAVLAQINSFRPNILMVGMGMPIQEKWISANQERLNIDVVYATGAAIEYFSGVVSRPPAWVSNAGLEGLYRLLSQPKKLWRRYLVEPFALIAPALHDVRARFFSRT